MIVTTYTGYFEILENSGGDKFQSVWSNKSEMNGSKGRGPMSLTLIDYSENLDM